MFLLRILGHGFQVNSSIVQLVCHSKVFRFRFFFLYHFFHLLKMNTSLDFNQFESCKCQLISQYFLVHLMSCLSVIQLCCLDHPTLSLSLSLVYQWFIEFLAFPILIRLYFGFVGRYPFHLNQFFLKAHDLWYLFDTTKSTFTCLLSGTSPLSCDGTFVWLILVISFV